MTTNANIPQTINTLTLASAEFANVKNSTYGAVGDGSTDDTAAFQAAINSGRPVFIPDGTYNFTSLEFGDLNYWIIQAPGAVLRPQGAGEKLKFLDGLTAPRSVRFENLRVEGDVSVNQKLFVLKDQNAHCTPVTFNAHVKGIKTLHDIQAGDVAYLRGQRVKHFRGTFEPTVPGDGNNILATSPNPAGSLDFPMVITFTDCLLLRDDPVEITNGGWSADFDGDFDFNGGCTISIGSLCRASGIAVSGQFEVDQGYAGTPSILEDYAGGSWDAGHGTGMFTIGAGTAYKISAPVPVVVVQEIVLHGDAQVILNGPGTRLQNVVGPYQNPPNCAIAVDVLAGADSCVITGSFQDCTTAAIRTAALGTLVHACSFSSTGAHNTVLEIGAADDTQIADCSGLATGAGVTLIGDHSFIDGEGTFEARMQRDSATAISLRPYKGKSVVVNGEIVGTPTGGRSCANTDNLITATGANSGGAPTVNTLYYAYVSNGRASYASRSLRLSASAPTTLRGQKYLASSGNGANWRFVGWVRTISNGGTPNFADSLTQRLVINYHNRRDLPMITCPGYVDGNNNTTFNESASATWKEIHAGTGDGHLDFVATGEDEVVSRATVQPTYSVFDFSQYISWGIGESATSPKRQADTSYDDVKVNAQGGAMVVYNYTPAEGFRQLFLNVKVDGTVPILADTARNGASEDPMETYLCATVKG